MKSLKDIKSVTPTSQLYRAGILALNLDGHSGNFIDLINTLVQGVQYYPAFNGAEAEVLANQMADNNLNFLYNRPKNMYVIHGMAVSKYIYI